MKTAAVVALCLCIAGPATTLADEPGFYFGANALSLLSTYRRASLDSDTTAAFGGADRGYAMGPSSVDRTHISWTTDFGYMVTPNVGVEVSYIDLGSLRYSGYGTVTSELDGSASEVHLNLDVRTHGPALAVVGVLPMSNFWDLNARVGAFRATTKSHFHQVVGEDDRSGSYSDNSTSLLAGVGASLTLTTHCVLRLEYLRLQNIKEKGLDHSFNVDAVTAGLAVVF